MTQPLSMDQAFIRKLTDIVLANLHDENFGVEKLAEQAGMSRASVDRQIKSIKDQDVSQLIGKFVWSVPWKCFRITKVQ